MSAVVVPTSSLREPTSARAGNRMRFAPQIGLLGVRALQVLLSSTESEWTIQHLAHAADVPRGQAQLVFRALEEHQLVRRVVHNTELRVIDDHHAAIDWLARVEQTRRDPQIVRAPSASSSPTETLAWFCERAAAVGVRYAVTAATGAQLLCPGLSTEPLHVQVRVSGSARGALRLLNGRTAGTCTKPHEPTIELWSDPAELASYGAHELAGVRVAQPLRVWLDLQRHERHAEMARCFRNALSVT